MESLVRKHFRERAEKGEYISKKAEILPTRHDKGRLLEVGCGGSLSYSPTELEVYGIDIVPKMAHVFRIKHPDGNIVVCDVKRLPFRDNTFDIIVSTWLLHHLVGCTPRKCVNNICVALREVKRVLDDGGDFLLREHLLRNRLASFVLFYTTFLCAKLHINIDFLDIHSQVVTYFLTEKELGRLCDKTGFGAKELSCKKWRFRKVDLGKYDAEFLLHAHQRLRPGSLWSV